MSDIYQHHRSDSERWSRLIDAANLEHTGDWPVVQVDMSLGAELVDYQDRLVEEVIYANDLGDGKWALDYSTSYPYFEEGGWSIDDELFEPANIITPGLLDRLFGDELEAGATVRFQCTVVDTYDCDDCRDREVDNDNCNNDHTLGWALIWAIHN